MNIETREVDIIRIGHHGDGETAGGLYVPFTVPGDRVRAAFDGERGRLVELLEPGPTRTAPPCKHFGICGGCALQHLSPDAYRAWKTEQITTALAHRGIEDARIEAMIDVAPRSRRRATLSAKLTREGVVVGFQERASSFIVDITECHIIDPKLFDLVPKLREALAPELPRSAAQCEIGLTLTDTGIDMTLGLPGVEIDAARRTRLAALATRLGLARLSVNGEVIAQAHAPVIRFADAAVPIRPGAFLQAVPSAEHAMQRLVIEGIGKAKRVADLFAGAGTFTFPAAKSAQVAAYEGDTDAATALKEAANHARGLKPIAVERRDLFRRPLLPPELDAFDAIVIDPPRAGAKAQSEQLARAKAKRIVMVSCNPATFARDARTLIDGGWKLGTITPIDQFLWAAHIELVASFTR